MLMFYCSQTSGQFFVVCLFNSLISLISLLISVVHALDKHKF